ncbi:hypothetical protein SAMN05660748_0466 [Blastococcus aggregatus]|uniref:Uncharacterized protein n=1 Tax=Blastococcus aggregatus TaxID=38502 RepID=A0A285UYE5_9ACTN|nr:DUF6766 family protein [Blastococcus aggregatus]SOC46830.1 hypothetical protein SAMN05660748_0466 [Blastococcus aggregatus]
MSGVDETAYGFLRNNALSLVFGGLFLATLGGQAVSGVAQVNAEQRAEGLEPMALLDYVTSSSFMVDVMENWQSEYLQFFLYVFATAWLVQKGSSESKEPGQEGTESDREQQVGRHATEGSPAWVRAGGWRTTIFSRSLGLVMGGLFLLTWSASAVTGWVAYNSDQLGQRQDAVTFAGYLGEADFWNRSFQNWQSEMLAVGSMAIFAVYLRQRGSPESKPVGAPHADTGATG